MSEEKLREYKPVFDSNKGNWEHSCVAQDAFETAWTYQESKISQLEKENAELQKGMIDAGEVIKRRRQEVAEKDKLIAELKEELAKERSVADFYSKETNVEYCASNEWVEEVGSINGYYDPFGECARQRIKERKEF